MPRHKAATITLERASVASLSAPSATAARGVGSKAVATAAVTATEVETKVKTKRHFAERVIPEDPQPAAPFDATAPLPNLGYACLNVTLRNQKLQGRKDGYFNNRTCRLQTWKDKGLEHVSSLALQNCRDLLPMLQWNAAHGIKLFRLSSDFFPWANVHYRLKDLPDCEAIKNALAEAGAFAREVGQRLTSHPSAFVKLAGQTDALLESSINDLELHSEMFDLLGMLPASPWNKINIHIGGTYGDKEETLRRFAHNFRKLSPNAQARVTVENDDRASMFSVQDLLALHDMLKPCAPIVFDFHHWRFCTGGMTSQEAMQAAMATWPPDVRPVVHWSESQGGKKPHAHSDYIGQLGRLQLHGHDQEVDVMIESKAKELSLLLYRDIARNGNAGREPFFLGVDAVEEEAQRVEAAKKAGEGLELEPVQSVFLEGTEIIPVNDKRLHGRSQRRNKTQVAARAATKAAAKADAAANDVTVQTTPTKKRQTTAELQASAAVEEAAAAMPASPAKPTARKNRQTKAEKAAVAVAAAAAEELQPAASPKPARKARRKKATAGEATTEEVAAGDDPVAAAPEATPIKAAKMPRSKAAVKQPVTPQVLEVVRAKRRRVT